MKPTALLLITLLLFSLSYADNRQVYAYNRNTELTEICPRFPGGDKALAEFITRNMRYPESAREKGLEGRVVVGFCVETDGSLTDFCVKKSVDSLLDNEALRIIKAMPKWEPGEVAGRIVRMPCYVPVLFRCKTAADDGNMIMR